jgi:hypothetical protein
VIEPSARGRVLATSSPSSVAEATARPGLRSARRPTDAVGGSQYWGSWRLQAARRCAAVASSSSATRRRALDRVRRSSSNWEVHG